MKNILILLFLLPSFLYSQDGTIDLDFNNPVHLNNPIYNGFSSSSSSGGAKIYTTKILHNGKIAVYGDFDLYQGIPTNKLAILNPNGSLDTSFNVGLGPDYVNQYYGSSSMICEQPDGKLIVVGSFTTFNGVSKKNIVRLNLDGTIDTSFNVGTSSNGYITCVKLQNDGKILCGGEFTEFNGQAYASLVRLNTNGTIDNSFNIGLGFKNIINSFTEDGIIKTIDIQNDNKIIVGGKFLKFNNSVKINLVRLNSNGTIDNSFNIGIGGGNNTTNGTNNGQIYRVIYDNSLNKIYITGIINNFNGSPSYNLLRLNIDGTIDTTFNFTSVIGYNGLNSNGYIYDMNLQSNGKILLGGEGINLNNCTGSYCSRIVQINQDGTLDTTFDCKLVGAYTTVYSIDSINDSIIVSGQFTSVNFEPIYKGSIVKVLQNGLTDLSFNPNLGTDPYTPSFASSISLNDGNIIANPTYSINYVYPNGNTNGIYNERITAGLIKINSDGSIHQNDYANFLTSNLYSYYLTKDNASNLISSNPFTTKIGENGLINNSFASTSSIIAPFNVNIFVYDHAVQNDGKIIIGGNFRYSSPGNNSYRQRLMRVNSNGTLDTSFNIGKGINGASIAGTEGYSVNTIALVPNNKIVLGGVFTNYNDNIISNIVRLDSNGTFDPTFNSGTAFNSNVYKIIYQQDIGKLIVVGKFTSYNSSNSNYIVRLNNDGTIDPTFTSPFAIGSTDSRVMNMVIQPDNKYIISGKIDGVEFLKRLNSNGTIDTSFANSTYTAVQNTFGDYDLIRNISLLPNNKILISGSFDHINSTRRDGIAVLNNSPFLSTNTFNKNSLHNIYIYPNPATNEFEFNSPIEEVSIYSLEGRFIKKFKDYETIFNINELKEGVYILKIKNQKSFAHLKLIKN
ncbi:T9SS type A sorting domain-containing protein [Flavobacterium lindanitolerans]|uniref:T9SS type A sorting domain-containing protein n=1 Tax=Flavobacterium lindanitolerans TaxID=428988 RepID=UPI0028082574|nr:T9SS type A sorting domain-containing protein [Flavobacterium lindanitolerans]MDQ7960906.1 T9SS type A sorting domain-containing protein [Flavobacterium lindanitolerans]